MAPPLVMDLLWIWLRKMLQFVMLVWDMIYLDFDFSKHPGKHTEYHKVIPLPDHELQCQLLSILFLGLGLDWVCHKPRACPTS